MPMIAYDLQLGLPNLYLNDLTQNISQNGTVVVSVCVCWFSAHHPGHGTNWFFYFYFSMQFFSLKAKKKCLQLVKRKTMWLNVENKVFFFCVCKWVIMWSKKIRERERDKNSASLCGLCVCVCLCVEKEQNK